MADGNDRPKHKQQQGAGYTLHPYYYQPYYAAQQMAGASYAPMVAQYGWPGYSGGYVAAMPMVAGAQGVQGGSYFFPYAHPAYAQYHQQQQYAYQLAQQQQQQHESQDSSTSQSAPSSSEGGSDPPPVPSLERTKSSERVEPIGLVRKISRGFSKDKSKWRLSRTGSKLSTDEDMDLPSSPLMGRKQSYAVSPRGCGSAFLADSEVLSALKPFEKDDLHIVEALRIMSNEVGRPKDEKLILRLAQLEDAARVEMHVVACEQKGEVLGLQNQVNSKICYLNSVVQILVSVSPLMQVLSFALTQGSAGVWSSAFSRIFRAFFKPPMAQVPSLLQVQGMETIVKELGGVGTQQDVAEALGVVLNKLHEEWKHALRKQPWAPVMGAASRPVSPTNHGLEEDSIVYRLFRGIRCISHQLEIFTGIHLAPLSGGSGSNLSDLLGNTLRDELHFLPPVLCIELSRHLSENQLTTSQTSVAFSGSLKVPSSCCTSSCNERKYQLIGAVVRSGVYANSGHFWVAQRRGPNWFWINDTDVSQCTDISLEDLQDETEGLISKKLEAASNWCVLVYADPEAKVAIHPYN